MQYVLSLALIVWLAGCDALGGGDPQPGTFSASLRGDADADFSGTAVVRYDSTRKWSPEAGIYYEDRYTIVLEGAEGFAGVVLPDEPATLSVTDASLDAWVQGPGTGYYSSLRGAAPRLVDLSVEVVGGELVGSFDAVLTSGGNPLSGVPSRKARGRGRFSATMQL